MEQTTKTITIGTKIEASTNVTGDVSNVLSDDRSQIPLVPLPLSAKEIADDTLAIVPDAKSSIDESNQISSPRRKKLKQHVHRNNNNNIHNNSSGDCGTEAMIRTCATF